MAETLEKWKQDGLLNDTIVIIMSDHGIIIFFKFNFITNTYQ